MTHDWDDVDLADAAYHRAWSRVFRAKRRVFGLLWDMRCVFRMARRTVI